MADIESIPLRHIATHPMFQVRRRWDPDKDAGLAKLTHSLNGPEGLIHPVIVVPCADTTVFGARPWTLVAGHRRLEAARRLGWEAIPARVLDPGDLSTPEDRLRLFAVAIRENTERRDLHPDDQREALWQLKQLYEAVYPATMTRGRREGTDLQGGPEPTPPAFSHWAAKVTSIPERTVRRDLRRALLGAQPHLADADMQHPPSETTQVASSRPSSLTSLSQEDAVTERLHQTATAGQHLTEVLQELAQTLTPNAHIELPVTQLMTVRHALQALQEATSMILVVLTHWSPECSITATTQKEECHGASTGV